MLSAIQCPQGSFDGVFDRLNIRCVARQVNPAAGAVYTDMIYGDMGGLFGLIGRIAGITGRHNLEDVEGFIAQRHAGGTKTVYNLTHIRIQPFDDFG